MNVAVIGSGVAGMSVAHALAERGLNVTILDVGEQLDEERQALVARLRTVPVPQWPREEYARLRHNPTFGGRDLPKKVHFGSSYIYAADRAYAPLRQLAPGRAPLPTFARGGFSNIWGAAVLPPAACDTRDWPVSRAELEQSFKHAARLIPLCGGEGTLEQAFPAYVDQLGELDPGPQGDALLQDLRAAEPGLSRRNILYGKARLAIHTQPDDDVMACNGCGECFTGCVRGAIYSTLPLLKRLTRDGRVRYRPDIFVEKIAENGTAQVDGIDLSSGSRCHLQFDSVFIAAGPIETTRILLRSGQLYDVPVRLKESQKFVIPVLRRRAARTAIEHTSVTLASVFLETKVASLSDHWLHVQIVPMHRLVTEGVPLPLIDRASTQRVLAPLLRRLMMAWCGMHSDHSSRVRLCLRRGLTDGADTLEMDLEHSPEARAAARLAGRALFDQGRLFGSVFCHWLMRRANPGSGTHCGASFPMSASPKGRFDTDTLGRPFGWRRVHAVDASVLPSIPGTTLAFPVMANATRIGNLAPI